MKPVAIMQNSPIVPPGTIADYLEERKIAYQLIKTYEEDTWDDLEEFLAMIVLGSPHSAIFYSQSEHLARLFGFVRQAVSEEFPVLGICFGSQLLTMALGDSVRRGETLELGRCRVKLTDKGAEDSLFHECESELTVFQWHRDRWTLPAKANLLATNSACPTQAFRVGKAVGIQFHPEVNREIVKSWCEEFAPDLEASQKEAAQILSEYDEMAEDLKKLNYRILDGFLKSTKHQWLGQE